MAAVSSTTVLVGARGIVANRRTVPARSAAPSTFFAPARLAFLPADLDTAAAGALRRRTAHKQTRMPSTQAMAAQNISVACVNTLVNVVLLD